MIIATCSAYPQGSADLQALAAALGATIQPWQTINPIQTPAPRAILPLAVWDYSDQPQNYLQWLSAWENRGVPFINSAALQRWNINKRYLLTLAHANLPVTPSIALSPERPENWQQQIADCPWENPVIKPLIGQSGKGVHRLTSPLPNLVHYPNGALLQPYIAAPDGEICLIYYQGEYSHAICRYGSDWRKNSAYGAQIRPITAKPSWRAAAETVFPQLPDVPLYARIDLLINAEDACFINEVELIEPALYNSDHSRQHLAQILRTLSL